MELFVLWILVAHLTTADSLSEPIRLGGLFHTRDNLQELSFRYAVEYSNKRVMRNRLTALAEKVPEHNSFQVARTVCHLLQTGVAGIFGPQSADTSVHVQSICDAKEIPHIETRWDHHQRRGGCSLNVYPHPSSLSQLIKDVVKAWNWKSFTIIYQSETGLVQFADTLKLYDDKSYNIMLRQLEKGDNYREVLRGVKYDGTTNIILDCSVDILGEVLKQAQQVGLMVSEYNFIITSLDMHTIDLEFLQYGGTNITGFRMVDPADPQLAEAVEAWTEKEAISGRVLEISPESVQLETALMNDAVWLFAKALRYLQGSNMTNVRSLDCNSEDNWAHGCSIINIMKASEIKGMTGPIKFDNQGFRTEFEVDLIELTGEGIQKIGTWNTSGVNLTRSQAHLGGSGDDDSLANKTFIVLIAINPPYGMLKEDSKQLSGNDRFEGFGIDLIHELSLMLGFNYTYQVQLDSNYGSLDKKTKKWSGMMKEIMEWRADLAITDLTINHDRESAVDFTMPFMNLGISILYKKPTKQPPSLFSFLSPFSNEVWMYMLGAYIGVSVLLFFMARISPYEWTNPYPCIEEPEELENQFSLKNSLWFTIGSLMQQGSEIAPIAVSTRMVAGIWWFFTLIMVSSYTANLAAFLTVESTVSPFKNVEELANQKTIKYGAKLGGSTSSFFQDSNHTTYKNMWKYMNANPDVFTKTNPEGEKRVLEEDDYAFLMESTSIEYTIERVCELTQVGGLLDNKGYGIAMRKNSPYRNALSTAVLKLQETGKLEQLKRKWWKEKRGGGACADDEGANEASELDLDNVGGVFVVLVGGVFIACFITIFEMLWNISQVARKEKVGFKEELMEELRFVSKCHGSTKPVRKRKSPEQNGDEMENCDELAPNPTRYGWFVTDEKKSPVPQ